MNHALPSPSNSPLPTHILFQSFSSKARATSPVAAVPLTETLRRWPSTPVPPFLPPAHVRGTSLTAFEYLPPTLSFQHVQCACAQCLTTEREACSQGDLHHVPADEAAILFLPRAEHHQPRCPLPCPRHVKTTDRQRAPVSGHVHQRPCGHRGHDHSSQASSSRLITGTAIDAADPQHLRRRRRRRMVASVKK